MSQAGRFVTNGGAGGGIETVTGNTGGPVGPDGLGNINIVGTNVITVDGNPGTFTETISLVNGTDGQVIIGGGANPTWATITAGAGINILNAANAITISATGGDVIVTKFTANGTWTKDANAKKVEIYIWNGGSGGGSGRQGSNTASSGGGGGGAGSVLAYKGLASLFDTSETVTIGAGGAGGAAQTSASTNGNPGTQGGASSLGNISITSLLTSGGGGGGAATGTGGNSGIGWIMSTFSQVDLSLNVGGGDGDNQAGVVGASAGNQTPELLCAAGGAGGGGADSGTERSGGTGGDILSFGTQGSTPITVVAGGTAGLESTTINGGAGNPFVSTSGGRISGGSGGGGGGGQSVGLVAGNGGAGGIPGGGGGGGGGSLNGTDSGAGGDGGRGEIWVIEYT